jgi:uroporphyrin-III C-methyltransferase/precorrin-2 dehydrogenase/sirohydrochlorin ferrochelatase
MPETIPPQSGAEIRQYGASNCGTVALVGAGPGDPELLTLKAVDRLSKADVIVHDALAAPEILTRHAPNAKCINAGKHRGKALLSQPEINDLLVTLAKSGLRVVRLKGGDPCVFGRAHEEQLALQEAGIEFEIIPGVSSLAAVPAAAGIIVTDRDVGRSLGAYSLHKRDNQLPDDCEWERMAKGPDTLILFMGRSILREASRRLIQYGRDPNTPAALVVNGTRPDQQVVVGTLFTLADSAEKLTVAGPGLIVLGEVIRRKREFAKVIEAAAQST